MSKILTTVRQYMPVERKTISSGWTSFNCPCCTSAGQPRPDTKKRGGMIFSDTGGFSYNCFNCKTKTVWEPGSLISKKAEFIFRCFGMSNDEIRNLKFLAWRLRGNTDKPEFETRPMYFSNAELPKGAKTLQEWSLMDNPPEKFFEIYEYLFNRDETLLDNYTYYWTNTPNVNMPNLQNSVIIPFYWNDNIVGWNSRSIKSGNRYYGDIPSNFLFNNEVLMKKRKYVVIVEGIFDAIALDGLGALGTSLNQKQIDWINTSDLEPIVVPDFDKAGQQLVDIALDQKWYVSIPDWEDDINDPADAVKRYGKIFALKTIVDQKEKSNIRIKNRRKRLNVA